jgi:hypothetical protein
MDDTTTIKALCEKLELLEEIGAFYRQMPDEEEVEALGDLLAEALGVVLATMRQIKQFDEDIADGVELEKLKDHRATLQAIEELT